MRKFQEVIGSNKFWLGIIVALLVLMSISLWLDFNKIEDAVPPENTEARVQSGFRGPVGEPFVKGPNEPPPGR